MPAGSVPDRMICAGERRGAARSGYEVVTRDHWVARERGGAVADKRHHDEQAVDDAVGPAEAGLGANRPVPRRSTLRAVHKSRRGGVHRRESYWCRPPCA